MSKSLNLSEPQFPLTTEGVPGECPFLGAKDLPAPTPSQEEQGLRETLYPLPCECSVRNPIPEMPQLLRTVCLTEN